MEKYEKIDKSEKIINRAFIFLNDILNKPQGVNDVENMVKYGNKLLTFLAGGVDKTNNVSDSIEIYSDKICPNVVNACPFEMLNELEVEIKKAITPSVLNSKRTQSITKLIENVILQKTSSLVAALLKKSCSL